MKRIKRLLLYSVVGLLMFIMISPMYSQEIHWGESHTVYWDQVTTMEDGSSVDPEAVISYNVRLQDRNTQTIFVIEELKATTITITYEGGVYICGVSSIIEYPDGTKIENSDITWSIMTDIERVPIPFFAGFYGVAAVVKNLRVE